MWIFSVIKLLPSQIKYGGSAEIDLIESRGNLNYANSNGVQIGVQQVTSALHFGPKGSLDKWHNVSFTKNNRNGFDRGFHSYEFLWNENGIRFFVDKVETGFVSVDDSFWKRGDFMGNDIWASGTKIAPFDQEVCHIIHENYEKF